MLSFKFLQMKSRDRFIRSWLFAFIALAMTVEGDSAIADQRPSVLAQRFDDDCGIAALRMLLQRAGEQVSDATMFSALSQDAKVSALSSGDLQELVRTLSLGYTLDIGFTDAETATELAEFEAFMVLIKPTAMIGLSTINHFVLVEGVTGEGWLIADPILGQRVIFPFEDIGDKLVGRDLNGMAYPMILRLIKNGQGAAQAIDIMDADLGRMTWETAYKRPRSLQQGKTIVSFGATVDRIDINPGFGISEMIAGGTLAFGATHGLSAQTMGRFNLSYTSTDVTVSALGESITFGLEDFYILSLGLDHVPKVDLPEAFALSTSADISWLDTASFPIFSVGAQITYVDNKWTFGLNADVVHDGAFQGRITPSVSYAQDFEKSLFDLTVSLRTDLQTGDTVFSANVGLLKLINNDLSLRFSGGVTGSPGSDALESSVSMHVVYAIPRRFRRGN